MRRTAFTLIELLLVVTIIGMLMGLLFSAMSRARENAKKTRADGETGTLRAAIWAYRHEYGEWPLDAGNGNVQVFSNNNYLVLNWLKPGPPANSYNPRDVHFINRGDYGFDESGNVIDPWGSAYVISNNLNNDTVTVRRQ